MRRLLVLAALAVLPACNTQPPPPPAPRDATPVNASLGRTWDAVIDVFASRNIPIRNMERVSGFISTEALGVNTRNAVAWADCGKVMGMPIGPERATYNVLVRGDSTHATVKTTVAWTYYTGTVGASASTDCTTKGVFESDLEKEVAERAQR